MQAPLPLPDKDEIYKKTFEPEEFHNFFISYDNYQNKYTLFNFRVGLSQNNISISSKEKKDFNLNEYKNVFTLDNLKVKNKQFKSYDNIKDAYNQIIKLFEKEKIIIKYFSDKEMKLELKLLNFTGEEEAFNIMLFKQEINKDSLIQELIYKVISLEYEIKKLKENNYLEKEIMELKEEKDRQAQEIENLKEMMFLMTGNKNIYNENAINNKKKAKIKYKIDSKIIKDESMDFIIEKISKLYPINSKIIEMKLLYRGSEHNFETESFHSKCDKIKQTLTLIKNNEGLIFGGFTSESWEGNNIMKKDNKAFCFSINLKKIYDIKYGKDAIKCNINYGPIFMNMFSFRKYNLMIGECNGIKTSNFYGIEKACEINGGEKEIKVDEIEIFEINI